MNELSVYTIIKFTEFDNGVNRKLIHMFLAFYYKKIYITAMRLIIFLTIHLLTHLATLLRGH